MTFTVLSKKTRGNGGFKSSMPRVTFAKYASTGGIVGLTAALVSQIKWQRGQKVQLSLGNGQDTGWLRVAVAPDGYSLTKAGKSGLQFPFNHFGKEIKAVALQSCKYNIIEGPNGGGFVLYIELPSVLIGGQASAERVGFGSSIVRERS